MDLRWQANEGGRKEEKRRVSVSLRRRKDDCEFDGEGGGEKVCGRGKDDEEERETRPHLIRDISRRVGDLSEREGSDLEDSTHATFGLEDNRKEEGAKGQLAVSFERRRKEGKVGEAEAEGVREVGQTEIAKAGEET